MFTLVDTQFSDTKVQTWQRDGVVATVTRFSNLMVLVSITDGTTHKQGTTVNEVNAQYLAHLWRAA